MRISTKFELGFSILLLIFTCAGCATVYNSATGKKEYVFISANDEYVIGQRMAVQIERQFKPEEDPLVNARVRAIGHAIANVSDRKDVPYTFKVLKDKDVNAFTTPGGRVYLFTGLLEKAASDAELASVIAHEIGHVAARHAAKKMELEMGYGLVTSLAFSSHPQPELERYINVGFNLINLGYSREDELFADKLAVRYLVRAGYDPFGMITLMEKLEKMSSQKGLVPIYILSTHPYMSQRIEAARKEIIAQMAAEAARKAAQSRTNPQ